MSTGNLTVRAITALVCDDVRREENRKEMLIGIYSGGILVEKFPARLTLCLWILLQTAGEGQFALSFRVVDSEDKELVAAEGTLEIAQSDDPSSLALPKMPIKVEKATTLRFQWKHSGGDWETVIEKSVRLNPAIVPETVPSA